jgi:hypothetical protein
MADTVRTRAQLQTLLADNVIGDISPQDIRDMLVSLIPNHGSLYRNVAADTVISTPGTYVKAAGTSTSYELHDMDMPDDLRLRSIAPVSRHYHITASISMTAVGASKIIGLKLAKNGVVLDETVVRRFISTGTDIGAAFLHGDMSLDTNDYVEIWVTNYTSSTNVRLDEFNLHALGTID